MNGWTSPEAMPLQPRHLMTFSFWIRVLAFVIPVFPRAVPATVAVVVLAWLGERRYRLLPLLLPDRRGVWVFGGFFGLHLTGMLYSENLAYGWSDVGMKASLLLMPFLLVGHGTSRQPVRAFVAGCLIAGAVLLVRAAWRGAELHSIDPLFYKELSVLQHPGYQSLYANLALFAVLIRLDEVKGMARWLAGGAVLFLAALVIFLASKAGILAMAGIFAVAVVRMVLGDRRRWPWLAWLIVPLVLYGIINRQLPSAFDRFAQMTHVVEEGHLDRTSAESFAVRYFIWPSAWRLMLENPVLGTGTGDVKDALLQRYRDDGLTGAYENRLNAHNQFLQSGVALGLPGLLMLLWSLVAPAAAAFRRHRLYMALLGLTAFFCLFESILERQGGIVFYAFFNALFYDAMRSGETT